MQKVYRGECLSSSTIYEWFKGFKEGREDLNVNERSGQPKSAVNVENVVIVCEAIKKSMDVRALDISPSFSLAFSLFSFILPFYCNNIIASLLLFILFPILFFLCSS